MSSGCRLTRRVLLDGEQVSKSKAAAGVLGSTRLNMIGLGSTLVGLQVGSPSCASKKVFISRAQRADC